MGESVTQEILFFLGNASIARAPSDGQSEWHMTRAKVNIVDTIGLCDSALPPETLQKLIKEKLNCNMAYIDRVVIVCSGRIELAQQEAIKKFKEWLQFDKYAENFTFIYNKADMLEEDEKEEALFQMCALLEAGNNVLTCPRDLFPSVALQDAQDASPIRHIRGVTTLKEMKLHNAIGFKPHAAYTEIKDDLEKLLDCTMIPVKKKQGGYQRIPLNESSCSIL